MMSTVKQPLLLGYVFRIFTTGAIFLGNPSLKMSSRDDKKLFSVTKTI
jgi:hypothetical protein